MRNLIIGTIVLIGASSLACLLLGVSIIVQPHDSWEAARCVYEPDGVDNSSMYSDIWTHLPPKYQQAAYESDPVGVAHEGTHYLNSYLRSKSQNYNAAYVGNNYYLFLPEPNVTIEQVISVANTDTAADFKYVASTWKQWNEEPLYILDEWSSYVNGTQAAIELEAPFARYNASRIHAIQCGKMAEALVLAISTYDPQYEWLPELEAFVSWQTNRMNAL